MEISKHFMTVFTFKTYLTSLTSYHRPPVYRPETPSSSDAYCPSLTSLYKQSPTPHKASTGLFASETFTYAEQSLIRSIGNVVQEDHASKRLEKSGMSFARRMNCDIYITQQYHMRPMFHGCVPCRVHVFARLRKG